MKNTARFFVFTVILFIAGRAGTSLKGNPPQASNIPAGQRMAILVTVEEREFMLNEMRF